MEKEKLIEHMNFLNKIYDEYIDYEREYNRGSNKKIRDRGLANALNKISFFKYYVEKDFELYKLLTSETATDYHRSIIWGEFVSVQYFSRDLSEAISKINQKIKNFQL